MDWDGRKQVLLCFSEIAEVIRSCNGQFHRQHNRGWQLLVQLTLARLNNTSDDD